MLANGVHPKVASERLGHSKVGITLDLYSHVIPGMQEDAAAMVDTALKSAMQKRREEAMVANPVAIRPAEQTLNKIDMQNQWVGLEATTRIELVYTVLQTVA
jgi:hypothetical protein